MEELSRGRALGKVTAVIEESERSPMGTMKKIMQENPDIVNMSIGEANFDPPAELIDIACRLSADKVNRRSLYTSTRGLPPLRQAIARYMKKTLGADADPDENILVTVGGTEALHLAIKVLVRPGDKVLLPNPGWGALEGLMRRQGPEILYYPLRKAHAWTVDTDAVLQAMHAGVKVLVVNSPSNPTGAMVVDSAGWARIMEKAKELDIFVFSDEVYHVYTYEGPFVSAVGLDPTFENLLLIDSFSKAFAVMGWRIGYAVAHPWLIRQMDVYKETVSACTPSIAQWAFAEYLDSCDAYLEQRRAMLKDNMEKMVARLNAIPGVFCPKAQGGFYLLPDFSALEPSSVAMVEKLLRGGVATAPGAAFGSMGEGCLRLLFSQEWLDVDKVVSRIEKTLAG